MGGRRIASNITNIYSVERRRKIEYNE